MRKLSASFVLSVTLFFFHVGFLAVYDHPVFAASTSSKTLQIGHILSSNEDDPYQVLCVNFAKNVDEMSGGTIKIEVIPNAQLGGERDMIEGMQLGTIDLAMLTNVNVGSFLPEFLAFDLPFIFPSAEKAHSVLDGSVGRAMLDRFERIGIKGLAWGEGGFRQMINKKRAIREPEDVKGLKFRSLENPLYIDTYRAIGTNPTPMAWTETFTGMQQGTIDGLDIPISVIYSNRFYEVADNMSLTNHFYSPLMLTVSMNIWNAFTPKEQDILMNAAIKAGKDERKFVSDMEQNFLSDMSKKGLKITTDVDYSAFQKAVAPVYENYRKKIGPDVLDSVLAAAQS
jgi:tripartite ATP-independent transporter DctP family solute receptor